MPSPAPQMARVTPMTTTATWSAMASGPRPCGNLSTWQLGNSDRRIAKLPKCRIARLDRVGCGDQTGLHHPARGRRGTARVETGSPELILRGWQEPCGRVAAFPAGPLAQLVVVLWIRLVGTEAARPRLRGWAVEWTDVLKKAKPGCTSPRRPTIMPADPGDWERGTT
jgi:hypothetical protein